MRQLIGHGRRALGSDDKDRRPDLQVCRCTDPEFALSAPPGRASVRFSGLAGTQISPYRGGAMAPSWWTNSQRCPLIGRNGCEVRVTHDLAVGGILLMRARRRLRLGQRKGLGVACGSSVTVVGMGIHLRHVGGIRPRNMLKSRSPHSQKSCGHSEAPFRDEQPIELAYPQEASRKGTLLGSGAGL